MAVQSAIEKFGFHCTVVELGCVETLESISEDEVKMIKAELLKSGLEVMENKRRILTERIKNTVVEMVYYADCQLKVNFSDYLSSKLKYDYTYLANTFSTEEGITIEHFIILHKVHRIKELIGYDELNLTEISFKLNYSSVAHLSAQFKKITGITPSDYKHCGYKTQVPLESV